MPTPKTVEFHVQGTGNFPVDMLRYDSCYPKSELDSGEIARSFDPRSRQTRLVALLGPHSPTIGRWESFQWKVV